MSMPKIRSDINTIQSNLAENANDLITANGQITNINGTLSLKSSQIDLNTNIAKTATNTTAIALNITQIASLASGSPKGTYATLSALQSAFPSGNTNTYVVIADGKWYYYNAGWIAGGVYQSTGIADKSIITSNIADNTFSDITNSINVKNLDKNNFIQNIITGFLTGVINSAEEQLIKSFVPNDGSCVYPTDLMPKCLRLSINASSGVALSRILDAPYQTGANVITGMWIRKSNIIALGTRAYFSPVMVPSPSGTQILQGGFVINNLLTKGYTNTNANGWVVTVKEIYGDWIYVTSEIPASVFPSGTTTFVNYYGRFPGISTQITQDVDILGLACVQGQTTIDNTRIYYDNTTVNTQLNILSLYKLYEAISPFTPSQWKGKKWTAFGDSITAFGTYESLVNTIIGFASIINSGVGGTTVCNNDSTGFWSRIQLIDKTADLLSIMGGTNDFNDSYPIGVITDETNATTFYGSLNLICKWVIANMPNCKLVLFTTTQRLTGRTPNSLGFTLNDYRNAMIAIADKYSLECLDLYAKSGITQENIAIYTDDNLHPNTSKGMPKVANEMVRFFNYLTIQ